jgi:hypothetical protein
VHGLAVGHGLILTVLCHESSVKQDKEFWTAALHLSLKFGRLSLCFLDDGNIGVGILPEREEILVDGG